jgi:hypothetical protein
VIEDSNIVEQILRAESAPTEVLADAFDAYHASPNHWALHENLRTLPLSDDTKAQLLRTKFLSLPPAVRAIGLMETLDAADLRRAETHPHVLQAILGSRK